MDFPLLVDEDLELASKYGAVAEQPGEWEGIPLKLRRSTFVIDANGRIEKAMYGVKVAGHVAALKDALGA